MSLSAKPVSRHPQLAGSEEWTRTARRARQLSWLSLGWMTLEGVVGLMAGLAANSISVIVWATSSFAEGLASMIVIWRFTGTRLHSASSERTAQRFVAGSFLVLVPYFLYDAAERLINGSDTEMTVLGVVITSLAVVLMPLLGVAKLRLGKRLGSDATAGEGIQNLLCAVQAAAALAALVFAGLGVPVIDPIAALIVSAIAVRESLSLWRGEPDECCAPVGFGDGP